MDLHPIIVHFPIALLTLYGLAELLRFKALRDRVWWFYVKAALVIPGALTAGAAYLTGNAAADALAGDYSLAPVIAAHENWAKATIIVFGMMAAFYVATFLLKEGWIKEGGYAGKLAGGAERILAARLPVVFALLGLAAITITGALGGSIVHGPEADPVVRVVYRLLGL